MDYITRQAPLFVGFSRPEYWSGCHFLLPGDLPDPGIKPGSPALQMDSLPTEQPGKLCKGPDSNFFELHQLFCPGHNYSAVTAEKQPQTIHKGTDTAMFQLYLI